MQPWMLPNVDKPHTVQIVQTSSAAAMEPNFNTTPFTPAVTPYEKPKATLLFKRPDGTFEKIKEPTVWSFPASYVLTMSQTRTISTIVRR